MTTSYDLVPYPGGAHRQTHPSNSAAIAQLLGLRPRRSAFRVLELGCGHGDNLTPMAYTLSDCEFLGVDLARTAIERGRAAIAQLGLANLRLEALDLMEFPADAGQFDYIIVHGLYSWVPEFVREKVLAICRVHLAPQGVAFVSFNAHPGGQIRIMLRDMMRRHTAAIENPRDKIAAARELLEGLSQTITQVAEADPFAELMRAEVERARRIDDGVFFHDDLADVNVFFYFADFAADAARHGLAFLSEAEFFQGTEDYFAGTRHELLQACGEDLIRREQLRDYFKCRRFRQPLLVHAEAQVNRTLDPRRMLTLYATARTVPTERKLNLAPGVEMKFAKPGGSSFATNHPLTKAVFSSMADRWPEALRVSDLIDAGVNRLAKAGAGEEHTGAAARQDALDYLFDTYRANFVELHGVPVALSRRPSEKPRASLIARTQLATGSSATTLCHEEINLDTEVPREVLKLLDGTRDRAALLAILQPARPEMTVFGGKAG